MKRLIYLFCVTVIYAAGYGQNIIQAEYFVNNDPGSGNGTAIFVPPGINEELNFNVNTNSLQNGYHNLFIRVKDENGKWSTVVNRPFMVGNFPLDPLQPVIRAEYFIDEDHGQGMGAPILFDLNNGIAEKTFLANLQGFEVGSHNLYVRTLDEKGHWSITYAESFEVELPLIVAQFSADVTSGSLPLMVQFADETYISEPYEWFWDFGDGNTSTLQHPQNTYAEPGKYTVSLTATSPDGTDTETKVEYITVYPPLYSLEYFFDNDPGFGNGTFVGAYSNTIGGFEFTAPLEELSFGFHQMFFRVQDTAGQWSHTYSHSFVKAALISDALPDIVQVEYFVDEDPGYGTGHQLAIDPGTSAIVEVTIPLGNLNSGIRRLFVRAKDQHGHWSIVYSQEFEIEPSTSCPEPVALTVTNISVNAATLSWNPGGTEMEWEVLWGLNGFDPETEGILIQSITDDAYLLEGLSPATAYDFYVRAVCTDEVSELAGPASFSTEEEQIIELPALQTAEVVEITETSAISGGNITDDGGAPVTIRGVVWSTLENPTLETNEGFTSDGTGTGSFVSFISDLIPATTYFVKAYATNSGGTGYGEEFGFTTLPEAMPGINLIRGGPPETEPLAIPIQIAGENTDPWNYDLNNWTGNWGAPQGIFDQGEYMNNPDFWSNFQGNPNMGSTWGNVWPGVGYGILVVDLQQVRSISNISVFQMFSDGKTTHIALAGHAENGDIAPDAFDPGWVEFLEKSAVSEGTDYSLYIGDPTKFTVNTSTRYVKIMAFNDGSLGYSAYIELKGIKMYGGGLPIALTLQNITVGNNETKCYEAIETIVTAGDGTFFHVEPCSFVYLAAGQNVLMKTGTHITSGSGAHILIDDSGEFCMNHRAIVSAHEPEVADVSDKKPLTEEFFRVYPNPTTRLLKVEILETLESMSFKLELINIMGKKVLHQELLGSKHFDIDLSDLPAGIYILTLINEGRIATEKIIRQ